MRVARTVLLAGVLVLLPAQSLRAQPPAKQPPPAQPPAMQPDPSGDVIASDERLLREAKTGTDAAALLDYFRKRTYAEADPKKLDRLVRELGDRLFRVREKAQVDLIGLGPSGLIAVREAENSRDDEVRRRALEIRQRVEKEADPIVQATVARLLAVRKPAAAAEVLLNYLPFAADESVVDEIARALPAVTVRAGKTEPAVVAALKDKSAVKRAAAGAALVKAGIVKELPAVRAMLEDREPLVQLRVALALVTEQKETAAVGKVIGALEHLPPEQLWQAEELLLRIAGEKAPQVSLGTDPPGRKVCRKAWDEWWAKAKDHVQLAKLELSKAFLGYTLVVQRTFNRIVNGRRLPPSGMVSELDNGKNVRWKIELPSYPVDAEVVGPDRVLLTEFQGMKISERDFKGNVKWEKAVNGNPLSAQRLPNGNTFVTMQNRLVEYSRKGDEVWHMDRPNFDIFRGRKLRNGEVVFITQQGVLTRLEPKTSKTLASFNVGPMGSQFGNFDVLPNGNFLVPVYGTQRVIEFDPTGKQVWQAQVQWPTSVQRLPNGRTLVGSQISRRVVEVGRDGKESPWVYPAEGQVFMVRRR